MNGDVCVALQESELIANMAWNGKKSPTANGEAENRLYPAERKDTNLVCPET